MITPCNMHLDKLAERLRPGPMRRWQGGRFNTITVSDGIAMGTPGMRYSLVSREVIADSIEAVVPARGSTASSHWRLRQEHAGLRDGHGAAEPAVGVRLRRHDPPGHRSKRDIVSVFEAVGAVAGGKIDETELLEVNERIPGPVPAAACTRPTRWRRRSRRWA